MKKIFLIKKKYLKKNKFYIKYIEDIRDEVIAFLDKDNVLRIFSSICPHFGGEIFFDFKNDKLRCKWHDWEFCKSTGECLTFKIKTQLRKYDFKINPNNLKKFQFEVIDGKVYILSNE